MTGNKTLWWTLLVGWIIGSTYWHVCKVKQLCDIPLLPTESIDTLYTLSSPEVIPPTLTISDSSQLILNSTGNFHFARSGYGVNDGGIKTELDSLSRYILANPNKRITITGSYTSQETNSSIFPDLGIARANEVKVGLLKSGIPDSIFTLKSSLLDNIFSYRDSIVGGITFNFRTLALLTETDLANAEKYESIFKPMDLYFPTASAQYIKTAENQKFLIEAKKYLTDNKDKKLSLTGHTDNEDSAEWNLILSKKRAFSIKKQFSFAGIAANRIIVDGKGETQPKVSNDSPQGKRANRRVTIVVQ